MGMWIANSSEFGTQAPHFYLWILLSLSLPTYLSLTPYLPSTTSYISPFPFPPYLLHIFLSYISPSLFNFLTLLPSLITYILSISLVLSILSFLTWYQLPFCSLPYSVFSSFPHPHLRFSFFPLSLFFPTLHSHHPTSSLPPSLVIYHLFLFFFSLSPSSPL